MNKIMVDNWFMKNVYEYIKFNNTDYSPLYYDLLMAIILWDEVYYPQNKYSNIWGNDPSPLQNLLLPIIKPEFEYSGKVVDDIALKYLELSYNNECDYLPCPLRRDFLAKNYQYRSLNRMKIQNILDNEIEDYYNKTFAFFSDSFDFRIKMPVLVNFTLNNTPKDMESIDYALHLKNEGAVVNYRRYLKKMEDSIENQDWIELRFLLKHFGDTINDIIILDNNHISCVNTSVAITPSVLFDFSSNYLKGSLPISLLVKENFLKKHKIHLTFLRDLTQFAITDLKFNKR